MCRGFDPLFSLWQDRARSFGDIFSHPPTPKRSFGVLKLPILTEFDLLGPKFHFSLDLFGSNFQRPAAHPHHFSDRVPPRGRMSHYEEQNMAPKKPDEFYSWRLMHFAHILQSNSKCWHWDNRKIPASYVDMQNQLMQCWIQTNMAILGASMNINAFMMIMMTSCIGKGFPISYHLGSHGLPDTKGQ